MNHLIELSLCALAWSVALFKFQNVWRRGVWRTDPIALTLWLAMFFFAVTMTFLVESLTEDFDKLTLNNLSRLIAYTSISLTLFFTTASTLFAYKPPQGVRLLRLIALLLAATLLSLSVTYFLYISKNPEWQDHHVPRNLADAFFMFGTFSFSLAMCWIMVRQNARYLRQENVVFMRVRVITVIMTALTAEVYFLVKLLLVAGYFWKPLSSDAIVAISKILLISSALMWAIAFVNNKVYLRFVGLLKGLSNWFALRDLEYLLAQLNRLCPPVALIEEKPSPQEILHNSEYHLYRATIRILDGKTLLADFLNDGDSRSRPEWWDSGLLSEAKHIHRILRSENTTSDFWEIVRGLRRASKELLQCDLSRNQGATAQ